MRNGTTKTTTHNGNGFDFDITTTKRVNPDGTHAGYMLAIERTDVMHMLVEGKLIMRLTRDEVVEHGKVILKNSNIVTRNCARLDGTRRVVIIFVVAKVNHANEVIGFDYAVDHKGEPVITRGMTAETDIERVVDIAHNDASDYFGKCIDIDPAMLKGTAVHTEVVTLDARNYNGAVAGLDLRLAYATEKYNALTEEVAALREIEKAHPVTRNPERIKSLKVEAEAWAHEVATIDAALGFIKDTVDAKGDKVEVERGTADTLIAKSKAADRAESLARARIEDLNAHLDKIVMTLDSLREDKAAIKGKAAKLTVAARMTELKQLAADKRAECAILKSIVAEITGRK